MWPKTSVPPEDRIRPAQSSTPWGLPNPPMARRTCGPWRCSRCSWATSASPAGASTRCAANPMCRGPRITACSTTCFRDTWPPPNTARRAWRCTWPRVSPRRKESKSANWWQNGGKYVASLLKAWWGEHANAENAFCYDYLPKYTGNCSYSRIIERMHRGEMEGLVCMGMNPAVGGPNSLKAREGLGKLKWLVTVDLWETETSIFWKRPGADPKDDQDRGVHAPRRRVDGEGGKHQQLGPLGPVAVQGGGAAGRGEKRSVDPRPASIKGSKPSMQRREENSPIPS